MITKNFSETPVTKDVKYKGLWTNDFNLENLTLQDVYMISQMEEPARMLPIGTEIPAKDFKGYDNPWIVMHYGVATVYDEETMTKKKQQGFYLQQKYHSVNGNYWNQATGQFALNDQYGAFRVMASLMEGSEYMAIYSTAYTQGQKVWLPALSQIQGTNANCFSYYTDTNQYTNRIACRYSGEASHATVYINDTRFVVAASAINIWTYITGYNWKSITTADDRYGTSTDHFPRLCCFIKGKDIED